MLQLGILLLSAAIVGADQLVKWLVVTFLKGHDPLIVWDGVLSLTYTENTGAAWNLFAGQKWPLIIITSVILAAVLIVLLSGRFRSDTMVNIGGILVVSGGVGNLIDRMVKGYVVDFIKLEFIPFPVFNLADCCVVVGALMLFVFFVFLYSERSPKQESETVGEEDIITRGKEEMVFEQPPSKGDSGSDTHGQAPET